MLKDQDYELILNDYSGVLVTEPINGYLEAFIFESNKPVRFDCSLDEFPGVTIWKEVKIERTHFIIMRFESGSNSENKFNYQYERLPLSNKLKFLFRGMKGTKIKLTVRYNDAR